MSDAPTRQEVIADLRERLLDLENRLARTRRAERELRQREDLYKSLFKNNHAVMLLLDPDTGNIVDANPAACEYYGYTHRELSLMKVTDLGARPEAEVLEDMRAARDGRCSRFMHQQSLSGGEVRDVEVYAGPVSVYDKKILYTLIHDVTDRNRAEARLRNTNRALRVLSGANEAVARVDDAGDLLGRVCRIIREQGGYRAAVVAVEEDRGLAVVDADGPGKAWALVSEPGPVGDALGKGKTRVIPDVFREPGMPGPWLAEAAAMGYNSMAALPFGAADGPGVLVICARAQNAFDAEEIALLKQLAKNLTFGLASLRVQVDKAQALADLEASRGRYQALLESVSDGVAVVSGHTIAYANAVLARMLGRSGPKELTRSSIDAYISDEDAERFARLLGSVAEGRDHSPVFEGRLKTGEEKDFWASILASTVTYESEPAILLTVRDVTESKLREMAMRKEAGDLRRENIRLKASMRERYRFRNIIGESTRMREIYDLIVRAARSDANVVLTGESGTGKELVAQAIHDMSERRDKKFESVNCGAIPETLLESEFFGYRKGAFTGALVDRHGYLDSARGGTLFLDEVGELDVTMQVKLLRAVGGGGYTPLGSTEIRQTDCRLICATNRNLEDLVRQGRMREDFYYRIHVVQITLPPLRERQEDIPLLVSYFMRLYGADEGGDPVPPNVMDQLMAYGWPGNVRELQNVIRRYLAVESLGLGAGGPGDGGAGAQVPSESDLRAAVESFERAHIVRALERSHWHRTGAARSLGITRNTLFRKMRRYGIE
ncbi:MAG: sigma 54-interacting transcriptional regulator [Desulfatibacillaceae bacterium]